MHPRIVIRGGYSATNIGNDFYVRGAEYVLRKVCPDAEIIIASDHPDYFWKSLFSPKATLIDYASYIPCDYLVLLGPMLDKNYPRSFVRMYRDLNLQKTKVMLLSAGGSLYDQEEIDTVRSFLKNYPHFALFTRDRETYKNYHDLFEYSYDGVCFALFASDYAPSYELDLDSYIVMNFDNSNEPHINTIPNAHFFFDESFIPKEEMIKFEAKGAKWFRSKNLYRVGDSIDGYKVIRTVHSCYPSEIVKARANANVYVSDVARDYLNLYANAHCVFTDRLHASVACLAYGTPVFLQLDSPRMHLLERIECERVTEGLFKCDKHFLDEEKNSIMRALSDIM